MDDIIIAKASDFGMASPRQRLIIGISGASGSNCAIELLKTIKRIKVLSSSLDRSLLPALETHVVISDPGYLNLKHELGTPNEFSEVRMSNMLTILKDNADVLYENSDIGSAIASGSFQTIGMVVIPCSIKTLSGIANSYNDNLITRAADVCLKEGRKVVLCVRETPLHKGHLKHMMTAADNGATIMPICPSFYNKPQTVEDIAQHFAYRVLQQFGYKIPESLQWTGINKPNTKTEE